MKTLAIITLTLLTLSFNLYAYDAMNGQEVSPEFDQVIQDLESQALKASQVKAVLRLKDQNGDSNCQQCEDGSFVQRYERPTDHAATQDGIPGDDLAYDDMADLLDGAYSSIDLIETALSERLTSDYGQRIRDLEALSIEIVQQSGSKPSEKLLRYTLNRARNVVTSILPTVGKNTAELSRLLANFYRQNFELAASFVNNNQTALSAFDQEQVSEIDLDFDYMHMTEFGRTYALLMWDYTTTLTSSNAKAIILMKLAGFLGHDLYSDLRRRSKPVKQVIADIYRLQQSSLYKGILRSLKNRQEPADRQLDQLRSNLFNIITKLNKIELAPITLN